MELRFLGGARTVTGSRFLLSDGRTQILIDCGLFQGLKELRLRNREPFPVNPAGIDAVVLTHAHIDHSGYLPKLVREGYRGPVFATPGTKALLEILLPDCAQIQEEHAEFSNKHGLSKHRPALPLYTIGDAELALRQVREIDYGQALSVGAFGVRLRPNGHLLGSSLVEVRSNGRRVVFSGDIGPYGASINADPPPPPECDVLVVESTYGDRIHPPEGAVDTLARVIRETVRRNGVVLIPAFAVGRSQIVLYHLGRLEEEGRIPTLPVFVDSPMAIDATVLYWKLRSDPNLRADRVQGAGSFALKTRNTTFARTREESQRINGVPPPSIILSASGMATEGRVLHHLKRLLPDSRNTVLLVGFQAAGTRGRRLAAGEKEVKIHGQMVPVQASVESISGFSAHADADDLERWIASMPKPPGTIHLVHGEPGAQEALAERLSRNSSAAVRIPEHGESFAA